MFPQTETIMIVYHQPKLRHGKMQRDAYNLRSYCTLPLRMSTVELRDNISCLLGAENKYVAMNKGQAWSYADSLAVDVCNCIVAILCTE